MQNTNPNIDILHELIQRLDDNLEYYTSPTFNEDSTRIEFIDRFFEALGWDVTARGVGGPRREVLIEQRISTTGRVARPDYTFVIDGQPQFVAEAKAISQSLDNPDHIFQLKSYAWSLGVPFAILTNFARFRVYDCRFRPTRDTPRAGLIPELDVGYRELSTQWGKIATTFGRNFVEGGSLQSPQLSVQRSESGAAIPFADIRGFIDVDDSFLADLEMWRKRIAASIVRLAPNVTAAQVRLATQRLLDKIMFVRVVEDREIRSTGTRLQGVVSQWRMHGGSLFERLQVFFSLLNDEFHGTIFRAFPLDALRVEDDELADLIDAFYFPSPYRFDGIRLEVLGSIYERFIGRRIEISTRNEVTIKNVPDLRHLSGVYYTPRYIVDTIVEEVVGRKILGKTPEQIRRIRILDPACGSGSFLIAAFKRICLEVADYYEEHPSRIPISNGIPDYKNGKLSVLAKARIALSSLFGFDKDPQAVEITILSLSLAILQDTRTSGSEALFLTLPTMTDNIVCCNTLVRSDYSRFCLAENIEPDDDLIPFDSRFENERFEAVIGNPPYIRLREMNAYSPSQAKYIRARFETMQNGNPDACVAFIERGLEFLKQDGNFGYIVSSRFMVQDYGAALRQKLSGAALVRKLLSFRHFQVFRGLSTYTCLLFLSSRSGRTVLFSEVLSLRRVDSQLALQRKTLPYTDFPSTALSESAWRLESDEVRRLRASMAQRSVPLWAPNGEGFATAFFVGPQTSLDRFFMLDVIREDGDRVIVRSDLEPAEFEIDRAFIRSVCSGTNAQRFGTPRSNKLILVPYDRTGTLSDWETIRSHPLTAAYFTRHEHELRSRELDERTGERPYDDEVWFRWGYPKNVAKQWLPKLTVPGLIRDYRVGFDRAGDFVLDNVDVCGIILPEGRGLDDYFYLMAILNSLPINFYWKTIATPYQNQYFRANRQVSRHLPIVPPELGGEAAHTLSRLSALSHELADRLAAEAFEAARNGMQSQLEDLQNEIDRLALVIYGITESIDIEYMRSTVASFD